MSDYDFFDLTGLPFDPVEKATKKVIAAIEKAKKDLNEALGRATQILEREKINEKLECLEPLKSPFVSGGKLTSAYENSAKTRTKIEIEKLTAIAELLNQSGRRWYTDGMLRTHRQNTKLSKERVEEIFREAGFKKSTIDPLKDFPKFPINADKIYDELGSLRKKKDPKPNAPDLAKIEDLYAFAAYLDGNILENAREYRNSKTTNELKALFDGKGKEFASRTDDLGKLLASIVGMGKSNVFNDDKNRKAYDEHLNYKDPILARLFSALKKIPKSDLLDPRFAEERIKQISVYFTAYDVALAIYNKEAGLTGEPYEPLKPIFYALCSHCHNISVFDNITHAQKENKCQIKNCEKPLFRQCINCKKTMLVSLEKRLGRCPECDFMPIDTASFAKYLISAEEALRKCDFESAYNFLSSARKANPNEKKETGDLAMRITSEEKRHAKPIEDLRKMLVDRAFQKAYGELTAIRGRFPALNISAFEAQINVALSQARATFASTKNIPSTEQVKTCLAILYDCVDFEPAVNLLAVIFANNISFAEQALRKGDFESARNFLHQAQLAAPNDRSKIGKLETQIANEEKRYEEPINHLRKLIAARMFQKAAIELSDNAGDFPGLFIFEAQILGELSKAQVAFVKAKVLPVVQQAEACLAILQGCADFEPAINCLDAIFANHVSSAEQALRMGDFKSALDFLRQARGANPSGKEKADGLAVRISAEEKRHEKPITDLRKLISNRMFQKAFNELKNNIGKFPGLFVFESQINTALSKAQTVFAGIEKLPSSAQARACTAILQDCVDFKPAINFLTAMFEKHYSSAEEALRKGEFESAHKFMLQAKEAVPSEQKKIDVLVALIDSEKKRYERPISDLHKMIADRMFQQAKDELVVIIGKFPSLDVSKFEMQINAELFKAQKKYENTKSLSPSKKADECLAILRDNCLDFKPAISYLRATMPEPCKGFSANIDSSINCVNINWQRSAEQGVTYRLLRKQGKEVPVNERDGEVLLNDTNETSYSDKNIPPGRYYGFAVFAIRYGIFSSAVGTVAVLLAEVYDTRIEQIDTTVRIMWNSPQNCTGVTIRRIQNGIETEIASNVQGSFEDKELQYRIAYSYVLVANYSGALKSNGVDLNITPMPQVRTPFTITATQVWGNTYRVSWGIDQSEIDLRIMVNKKLAWELKSGASSCDLELLPNGFHAISVLAYSSGTWLESENIEQVNTYAPCSIDKAASSLHENAIEGLQESAFRVELKLKVGGYIPSEVVGFYCAVKTGAAQNRWPKVQDIGKDADIHKIEMAEYKKNNEIFYTKVAREERTYYVSLFTIYNMIGKETVSDPKTCRFERPLEANIFWGVHKSLFGGLILSMEISGNRSFVRIPELVLCTCEDDQHLLSLNDAKQKLFSMPGMKLDAPQKKYNCSYEVKNNLHMRQIKKMKFFLFETVPIVDEKYNIRWATGFVGKV